MKRLSLALGVLALLAPSVGLARDVSGVHLADTVTLEGATLVLNGAGVRHVTIFGVEVYVAGLYLPTATHDASEVLRAETPREVVLVMKRDVGRDQIASAFREAIEHAAGPHASALRTELDAFVAWVPEMHDHDRMVVTYTPAHSLSVTATGAHAAVHGSAALAEAFFGMWVGSHPVEDSLRDGMLGR